MRTGVDKLLGLGVPSLLLGDSLLHSGHLFAMSDIIHTPSYM